LCILEAFIFFSLKKNKTECEAKKDNSKTIELNRRKNAKSEKRKQKDQG
jgi:hypothetical protein